ncbi:hypothetical protein GCM10022268_22360 [Sphingomonas cynarae]|uniref:Uncharacterized protein n=1 Tax=Sphingomonas cynarae TaxID=930197 RepID=A0ABP7E6Y3_9SPHN
MPAGGARMVEQIVQSPVPGHDSWAAPPGQKRSNDVPGSGHWHQMPGRHAKPLAFAWRGFEARLPFLFAIRRDGRPIA